MQVESEMLNGFPVPGPYADYWRDHPEIGLPQTVVLADGSQIFENGVLDWEEGQVVAYWRPRVRSAGQPTV